MSNNKNLTVKRDPIGEVFDLYSDKLVKLAETLANADLSESQRDNLLKQQSEALGAISALGKVRDLEYYNTNYDILSVSERKKIIKYSTNIY
ncbi:hypothetical protein KUA24_14 [Vibrio phage HNL01]|nr:hypothetical protein KUA24_14 [Vibrio phage HNL01]